MVLETTRVTAARLTALREENAMTQTEFAKQIGVSRGTVYNYENGYNAPPVKVMNRIGRLFDVAPDYLMGITDLRTRFSQYEDVVRMFVYGFGEAEALLKGKEGESGSFIDLPCDKDILVNKQYAALRVPDNSLEILGIRRLDYIILERCESLCAGRIGAVSAEGRILVGRVNCADGFVTVRPVSAATSAYQPVRLNLGREDVRVIGHAVKKVAGVHPTKKA